MDMTENIEKASNGGNLLIWGVIFGILIILVGYLAYINKDIER